MNFLAVEKFEFGFGCSCIKVYREESTDVLYMFKGDSGVTHMVDPETGLPLTYKVWKEKYKNKK